MAGIFDTIWQGVKDVASDVFLNDKGGIDWGGIGKVASGAAQVAGTVMQSNAQKDQNKAQENAAKIQAQAQAAAGQAQKQELYQQASDIEATAQRQAVAAALRQQQIRSAGLTQARQANAGYAASGVLTGVGSAGAATRSIINSAQSDAYTTLLNAQDTISTLNAQAAANRRHGDVLEAAGNYAAKEGTAAAVAASQAVSNANWANTLLNLGSTASGWLKS